MSTIESTRLIEGFEIAARMQEKVKKTLDIILGLFIKKTEPFDLTKREEKEEIFEFTDRNKSKWKVTVKKTVSYEIATIEKIDSSGMPVIEISVLYAIEDIKKLREVYYELDNIILGAMDNFDFIREHCEGLYGLLKLKKEV